MPFIQNFLFGNKIVNTIWWKTIDHINYYLMGQSASHSSTALIVDDEKDICYLLTGILRQKNIHASLAPNLAEAAKFVERNAPSIIFLDNYLPDGLGLESINNLKKINPAGKIVMITAHDNPSERQKAYLEGADFFISKPFTKEVIFKTLDLLRDEEV